jgi:hypothetical protein
VRSITTLLRGFQKEVALLSLLFESQAALVAVRAVWSHPQPTAIQSYATVRLHDAWARFCRRLVLCSAAGELLTATAVYVPRSPAVAHSQSPLDALKATYPSARQGWTVWEPKWFEPRGAIDAAQRLQIANLSTVSAGLGAAGHGVDELRMCRNFLVHRSRLTNEALDVVRARLGLATSTPAEQLVNTTVVGGARVFEVWWRELLLRAGAAVQ